MAVEAPLNPAIVKRLHMLLDSSDLDVTTEKHIRLKLETEFNIDLSERKKSLRFEIQNFLNSRQQNDDDEEQPEPELLPSPPKKAARKEKQPKKEKKSRKRPAEGPAEGEEKKRGGGGLMKLCSLSPQLSSFLGVPELPRTEVVKGMWKYIGEHKLQDPNNRRVINCDATLEQLLGTPSTDMFQLNKLLKPHIHTIPGDPVPKPVKEASAGGGSSALQRPLTLSPALSQFLNTGDAALPRSEVVKRVWGYIKDHNLQDPSNKKVILCDEHMRDLLGVDVIDGFGAITKLLSPHLGKSAEAYVHSKVDSGSHSPEVHHSDGHGSDFASEHSEDQHSEDGQTGVRHFYEER